MPVPRLKPSLFSIHPPLSVPSTRCLRTKPSRLPPRAAAFGIPVESFPEIAKTWRKKMRGEEEQQKIPLVPRVTDDGVVIQRKTKLKPQPLTERQRKFMEDEDYEDLGKLEEREERVKEFERLKKLGLTGGKAPKRTATGERIEEEEIDSLTYPRDVVGTKFRKEKVKYKYDMYELPILSSFPFGFSFRGFSLHFCFLPAVQN
jgi:hypothetical protein